MFFADGSSARTPVTGTVARGQLPTDTYFFTGKVDGQFGNALPFPLTRQLLERGQERYNIYCAPCHDRVGTGQGMIVRRGFRRPPSFHSARLRDVPLAHYFDVMSNGFGAMMDYAAQLKARDRWAITAYIRALQLSQQASLDDVPETNRQQLQDKQP
jgi:cytochrome c